MPGVILAVPQSPEWAKQANQAPNRQGHDIDAYYAGNLQASLPYGMYQQNQQVSQIQKRMQSPRAAHTLSSRDTRDESTRRKKRGNFFLSAIIVCVFLLLSIGLYRLIHMANTASIAKQTNTPSGNALVPSAEAILKDAQTSEQIDNTLAPLQLTKTFMANERIYVTFTISSGKQDGQIEAKWYQDGQFLKSTVLAHTHGNTRGVFSNVYITATPDGAVELYWCIQADCKDAQLAQVVHFTVAPIDTAFVSLRRFLSDVNSMQGTNKMAMFLYSQRQ